MMKHFKWTVLVVSLGAALLPAIANTGQRVGAYDFSYATSGDSRAAPVQVFDSGTMTYFQFRAGETVPAIFTHRNGDVELVVPRFEGPYVVVDSVHGHFVLQVGRAQAHVVHTNGVRPDAPVIRQVSASGLETPYQEGRRNVGSRIVATTVPVPASVQPDVALDRNSYATPTKGDRVEWMTPVEVSQEFSVPFAHGSSRIQSSAAKATRALALSMIDAQRIEITGRDDKSNKEGLAEARAAAIVDLFAAAGIPRSRMFIKTSAQMKTSGNKGLVVGVSLVSYSSKPYATSSQVAARVHGSTEQIVADLKAGRITASQAMVALGVVQKDDSKPSMQKWDVRASDATVSAMLQRWGSESGWTVIDKGAPVVAIHGDATVERPDFLKAADYAVTQARQAGFQIKASAYSNKVLVLNEEPSK